MRAAARTLVALAGLLGACAHAPARRAPEPSATAEPLAVWLDVDTAAGIPQRDIDDAVAMIQAFRSPELAVRGVSVVFGNAPLADALPIAAEVTARFGPPGLTVAAGAASADQLGTPTAATDALAAALTREPLVILALGPLTNVATLLQTHPELAPRITEVVAVAGRRPGQRFTTGTTNARGHRDFNFEKDPEAFRALLAGEVPLTLAPWEVSSKVWVTPVVLDGWSAGSPASRWLADAAPSWLALWEQTFGVSGFNPFDTLAIATVTRPDLLTCEVLPVDVRVGPDDVTDPAMQGGSDRPDKPYLVVDPDGPGPRRARYCYDVDASFVDDLTARLTADPVSP
ncbi:MAG: nucleoside hydrolase [Deltaproteobacteria bacterium]|nr:nucleoside hydrolase [Deltaproteobacteria bacterium]